MPSEKDELIADYKAWRKRKMKGEKSQLHHKFRSFRGSSQVDAPFYGRSGARSRNFTCWTSPCEGFRVVRVPSRGEKKGEPDGGGA